jgi:hypothetical protein
MTRKAKTEKIWIWDTHKLDYVPADGEAVEICGRKLYLARDIHGSRNYKKFPWRVIEPVTGLRIDGYGYPTSRKEALERAQKQLEGVDDKKYTDAIAEHIARYGKQSPWAEVPG